MRRRRWLANLVILTLLAVAVPVSAALLGLDRAGAWAGIVALALGVGVLVPPATQQWVDRTASADQLAEVVADLARIAVPRRQRLAHRDVSPSDPLPVRWARVATTANVIEPGAIHHDVSVLVDQLSSGISRETVIIGPAGVGKSTLADLLLLRWRGQTDAGDVVAALPFRLNLGSWNPRSLDLSTWASRQIVQLCRDLDISSSHVTRLSARRLVERGGVMLIFDGFDEIEPDLQAMALHAIERAPIGHPAVILSQESAFAAASATSTARRDLIRLLPLSSDDAAAVLVQAQGAARPAGETPWRDVVTALRSCPYGAAASVLRIPLFLNLARQLVALGKPVPASLLASDATPTDVETDLLDGVVDSVFEEAPSDRKTETARRRWLSTLAYSIRSNRYGTFGWWDLSGSLPWFAATLVTSALVYGVMRVLEAVFGDAMGAGLAAAVVAMVVAGTHRPGSVRSVEPGVFGRPPFRLAVVAAVSVLALGPDLGAETYDSSPPWKQDGVSQYLISALFVGAVTFGVAMLVSGTAAADVRAWWAWHRPSAPRVVGWNITRRAAAWCLVPAVLCGLLKLLLLTADDGRLTADHLTAAHVGRALASGALLWAVCVGTVCFGKPVGQTHRDDLWIGVRQNLLFGLLAPLLYSGALVVFAVVVGTASPRQDDTLTLDLGPHLHLAGVWVFAVLGWLFFGAVTSPIGLVVSAGGRYVVATAALTVTGQWTTPRKGLRFLRIAHERGVLRQSGHGYRLSHDRLADVIVDRAGARGTVPGSTRRRRRRPTG